MKEVTLKIPEQKLSFFMELMEQLGFEICHPAEIPKENMAVVRERILKTGYDPGRPKDWDVVKDDFKFDE